MGAVVVLPDGRAILDRRRRGRAEDQADGRLQLVAVPDDLTEPKPVRLSVIMAAYNEERTIRRAVEGVLAVQFPCDLELIVVDDGSGDATSAELAAIDDDRLTVLRHPLNLGKGTALRTARRHATGTHIVPFDADLEYVADDLRRLIEPVIAHGYPVVIGTRHRVPVSLYASTRYALGNRFLTRLANVLFASAISDLHSCLKLVSTDLLRTMPLRQTGFGADTELVASLLKRGIHPHEVPIAYRGRTRAEGKKIGWRDAVECVTIIGRHRLGRLEAMPTTRVVLDLTSVYVRSVAEEPTGTP